MRRVMFVGAAAAVIAAACADSSSAPRQSSASEWSGAVIEVATANPNAHGQIMGVVLDSGAQLNPSKATPIPGAMVTLNLKITVAAGTAGSDTATTTVTKIGQVVTDANGRFLVTSIPEGDYYIAATSPDATHYDNATWAFASTGAAEKDAVIYLPRKLVAPVDSTPIVPVHPIDTLPAPPAPPPTPTPPPADSL